VSSARFDSRKARDGRRSPRGEALDAIESAEARMRGSPEVRYTKAIILDQLGRKSEAEVIMRTLPH
jgi:Flp pilus assembly protein TadD